MNIFIFLIILFQLLLILAFAQKKLTETFEGGLIFQSYFEPDSKVIPEGSNADIIGTVRLGKWFMLEYYYKEGDSEKGFFFMSIHPDGEAKQVIFDLTHNTQDPNPDGVTDFTPLNYTRRKN